MLYKLSSFKLYTEEIVDYERKTEIKEKFRDYITRQVISVV